MLAFLVQLRSSTTVFTICSAFLLGFGDVSIITLGMKSRHEIAQLVGLAWLTHSLVSMQHRGVTLSESLMYLSITVTILLHQDLYQSHLNCLRFLVKWKWRNFETGSYHVLYILFSSKKQFLTCRNITQCNYLTIHWILGEFIKLTLWDAVGKLGSLDGC